MDWNEISLHCLNIIVSEYDINEIIPIILVNKHWKNVINLWQMNIKDYGCQNGVEFLRIMKHCNKIENLSLCHLTNNDIKNKININKSINDLTIGGCCDLDNDNLTILFQKMPNIEHLDLSYCDFVNDTTTENIKKYYPKLFDLNLEHCKNITDLTCRNLYYEFESWNGPVNLDPMIGVLNISNTNIGTCGLMILEKFAIDLYSLKCDSCELTDFSIISFLNTMKNYNLEDFSICNMYPEDYVDDKRNCISEIIKHCDNLQALELSGNDININGTNNIGKLTKLKNLKIDIAFYDKELMNDNLKKLINLERLCISIMDDDFIENMILPNLQILYIHNMTEFELDIYEECDECLTHEGINKFIINNPNIQKILLDNCNYVDKNKINYDNDIKIIYFD